MTFFDIIKTAYQFIVFLISTIFRWMIFIFIIFLVISLFLPDPEPDSIESDYKSNPFNDSIFHEFEKHFNNSNENAYTESNRLKIIKDCIAQVPNSSYTREWKDYYHHLYKQTFEIPNGIVCESSYNRNQLYVEYNDDYKPYWQNVYSQIIKFDTTKMQFIYDYFEKIRLENDLDYREFADLVVSFVQDIPYTLILSESKEEAVKLGGFSSYYIVNNKGPFVENIKFGFLSPLEFLHSIRGDCDTRTLTIYCILSHFGYDVVVLNCYIHSMIGLNLPSQGKALKFNGKKYYFWETTATGWELGQLPADYETIKDWYIALPSVNDY